MKKRKKEELVAQGEKAFKIMSFQYMISAYILVQILLVWISTKGSLFPGMDTIQSVASTCAQIVAGLYGITMAGYTFFLSRIDALMASDSTLSYIVASIKRRFKYLVWIISMNVLMTLFVSIVLMYAPVPAEENHAFFYRLFCNEFILSVAASCGLIVYYSLQVIDPNCIEKEAKKLKRKLCPVSGPRGSVNDFIMLYDQIEERCNAMLPQSVLRQVRDNKGSQFEYTIELMKELPMDMKPVLPSIEQIHMYYECVINCGELSVSQAMCQKCRWVLQSLDRLKK